MLTQENNHSQALLGQEAVIFKYLIARLLFYFLIAKHYISIICMFYRYIYCVCVCVYGRQRERLGRGDLEDKAAHKEQGHSQ